MPGIRTDSDMVFGTGTAEAAAAAAAALTAVSTAVAATSYSSTSLMTEAPRHSPLYQVYCTWYICYSYARVSIVIVHFLNRGIPGTAAVVASTCINILAPLSTC